jgi:hypothetical protein
MVDYYVDVFSSTNNISPLITNYPLAINLLLAVIHFLATNHSLCTNSFSATNSTTFEANGFITHYLSNVSVILNSSNTIIYKQSSQQRSKHVVYTYAHFSMCGPL